MKNRRIPFTDWSYLRVLIGNDRCLFDFVVKETEKHRLWMQLRGMGGES